MTLATLTQLETLALVFQGDNLKEKGGAGSLCSRTDERASSEGRQGLDLPDLEQVAGGDPEACERLMAALYPIVIRVIRSRLSLRLPEEDVAQEVFLKVFRKIGQYRGEVPIERWVARIAVTTCLNAMRAPRHRLEWRRADLSAEEDEALEKARSEDPMDDPGEAFAARELLGKLLESLSAKDRMVIEMLDLGGRTSAEAAVLLGTTSVALRVRAARARQRLKSHLKRLTGEDVEGS